MEVSRIPPALHSDGASSPAGTAVRVFVALLSGAATACLFFLTASTRVRMSERFRIEQTVTRDDLKWAGEFITIERTRRGKLPETLSGFEDARLREAKDGWDRPLVYERTRDSFTLASYGRDGKPGGVGLDCDLVLGRSDPEESRPTLAQFLESPFSGQAMVGSLATGFVVFVLGWVTIRPAPLRILLVVVLGLGLLVSFLGAIMVGAMLAALQTSGH